MAALALNVVFAFGMGNPLGKRQLLCKLLWDLHHSTSSNSFSFALLPCIQIDTDPLFCQSSKWFHAELKAIKAAIELISTANGTPITGIGEFVQLLEAKISWPTAQHLLLQSPANVTKRPSEAETGKKFKNCLVVLAGAEADEIGFSQEDLNSWWLNGGRNNVEKILFISDERAFLSESDGIPLILSLFSSNEESEDSLQENVTFPQVVAATPTDFSLGNVKIEISEREFENFRYFLPKTDIFTSISHLKPQLPALPSEEESFPASNSPLKWKDLLLLAPEDALSHLKCLSNISDMNEIEALASQIVIQEQSILPLVQIKAFLAKIHFLQEAHSSNPAVTHFLELYFCCCATSQESIAFARTLKQRFSTQEAQELDRMLQLTGEVLNSPLKQQQQQPSQIISKSSFNLSNTAKSKSNSQMSKVVSLNREILLSPNRASALAIQSSFTSEKEEVGNPKKRTKTHPSKAIPQTEVVVAGCSMERGKKGEKIVPETPFPFVKRISNHSTTTTKPTAAAIKTPIQTVLSEETEISITETPKKLLNCRRRLAL